MTDRDAFLAALRRVSFRLTYGKTEGPRRFREDGIDGPHIPDAFSDGKRQSGDWEQQPAWVVNGEPTEEATTEHWLAHFFSMAVNEAIHEALEHFQVDGKPYLNPHGKNEEYIYILVNELAANLAELAEAEKHAWGCMGGPRREGDCEGDRGLL
ncbi:hypothetical protein ACFW2V_14060 [Streptomyces sp. NPDC058947]|uniref:hypothetical protein n=1 Tax=Streptomyces sp. NPDC058947 TaxID=3346675 RepID=UPI00368DAEEB